MENVPAVCEGKNIPAWQSWMASLGKMGYRNYFKTISATDYGIPQNRKRCFMVSILGDYGFKFPDKIKLKKTLADFLVPNPPLRSYLSDKFLHYVLDGPSVRKEQFFNAFNSTRRGISPTLMTRTYRPLGCAFPTRVEVTDKEPDLMTLKRAGMRQLTPLEYMRLMGFDDKDEQAMRAIGMRDGAIVHCAGDSIVVDVLEYLFKEML